MLLISNILELIRAMLIVNRLINVLKAAKQDVPEALLKFGTTVKKKQHDVYGAFYKDVDMDKTATKITFDD
jgi:ATP-dependent RNA helicase DBP3